MKFIFLSLGAILCFFVPFGNESCFVVALITLLRNLLQPISNLIVFFFIGMGLLQAIRYKSKKIGFLSIVSFVVYMCTWQGDVNANEAIALAYSIFTTVFVSGTFTVLITESGLVEFIAYYLEEFMQLLFRVPGYAAMDVISSFFSSSSVGVFITSKYYKEKKYTKREACLIASNFSVVSIGFMYAIIEIAQLQSVSFMVIATVFFMNIAIGIIMARIPPISSKENLLIDKSNRSNSKETKEEKNIRIAIERGKEKAQDFSVNKFVVVAKQVWGFCGEILIQVIPIYFLSLLLMNNTNILETLAKPIGWFLDILQVPNGDIIAPGVFIGLFEVSLPAIYISEFIVELEARFFVAVLSMVQIVFFTETANAILQSQIPLNVRDLLLVWLVRTIVAIPMLMLVIQIL